MRRHIFALVAVITTSISSGAVSQEVDPIDTRFGRLTSNSDGLLSFGGKVVESEVTYLYSAAYTPIRKFKIGSADIILFQQAHGNACPGNFAFVTVTEFGAKATEGFGTCYDFEIEPYQSGESILFSMPNLGGKGKSTFIYHDGVVYKNI